VRWTLFALIEAEEQGINSENVGERLRSPDPNAQRLLGATGGFGSMLGLSDRWAYEAIRQVGNYGEIFARTLTPMGIDRGLNRLWNQGGPHLRAGDALTPPPRKGGTVAWPGALAPRPRSTTARQRSRIRASAPSRAGRAA
jgi:hypothetical protein